MCVFVCSYYSLSFYSPLSAGVDNIREGGRRGENSVAGHYIWFDAGKSFSVHHETSAWLPPLFPSLPLFSLQQLASRSSAPNHSLRDLALANLCVCSCAVHGACASVWCVSVCDLVPCFLVLVSFLATPTSGSQVGRREVRVEESWKSQENKVCGRCCLGSLQFTTTFFMVLSLRPQQVGRIVGRVHIHIYMFVCVLGRG